VIVGAVGSNGEDVVARARQQDIFIVDAPEQHVAVAERGNGDALSKVRLVWLVGHGSIRSEEAAVCAEDTIAGV